VIVLDASVLVAFFEPSDRWHTEAVALLAAHAGEDLVVPTLTLAEFLVGPARSPELLARAIAALSRLGVAELPLPADAAASLAVLRSEGRLKLPDCVVLLAAESEQAALATCDVRLASVAAARGVRVIGPRSEMTR